MELTTHIQLMIGVRMSESISPPPRMPSWRGRGLHFYEIFRCHGCGYSGYGIPGVTPCNLVDTNTSEESVVSVFRVF